MPCFCLSISFCTIDLHDSKLFSPYSAINTFFTSRYVLGLPSFNISSSLFSMLNFESLFFSLESDDDDGLTESFGGIGRLPAVYSCCVEKIFERELDTYLYCFSESLSHEKLLGKSPNLSIVADNRSFPPSVSISFGINIDIITNLERQFITLLGIVCMFCSNTE